MSKQEWRRVRAAVEWLLLGAMLGFLLAALVLDDAHAAVVEVDVHAKRDGWAKLYSEGGYVQGCTMDIGPCQLHNSVRATVRRVKVRQGTNRIRLHAIRWEWLPEERKDFGWLRSSNPDDVPQQAGVSLVRAPVNWAYVWGRAAGRDIEPIEMKVD